MSLRRKFMTVKKSKTFWLIYTTCAIAAVVPFSGCKQPPAQGNLSDPQVAELSAETAEQFRTAYAPADPQTPGLDEFNHAVARIVPNAYNLKGYVKLNFVAIESSEQLSISLPDGHVLVTSGLLSALSGHGWAIDALVAHEIGHVALQHDIQNISTALGPDNLENTLAQGRYEDVVNTEIELGKLSYSRSQEFDADDYAIELLRRSGLDPHGLEVLVETIDSEDHGT